VKVLVIGDTFADKNRICKATRLCPEAPVPVLVETESYTTAGGGQLVADQLELLLGENIVTYMPLSHSRKERLFAGGHLVARVDHDNVASCEWGPVQDWFQHELPTADAVVIADYGKNPNITMGAGRFIITQAAQYEIPVFVDAKTRWAVYRGAFAMFPNEHEKPNPDFAKYIIQKLGGQGCSIQGSLVPAVPERRVVDVTGAGDIFLAAFVAKYLTWKNAGNDPWHGQLHESARFANFVAGKSVEWVGTHVVKDVDINENF
jgi:bifunctional ADP-heptose synthase (sugar kinase/adenylyltransferase)